MAHISIISNGYLKTEASLPLKQFAPFFHENRLLSVVLQWEGKPQEFLIVKNVCTPTKDRWNETLFLIIFNALCLWHWTGIPLQRSREKYFLQKKGANSLSRAKVESFAVITLLNNLKTCRSASLADRGN